MSWEAYRLCDSEHILSSQVIDLQLLLKSTLNEQA